MQEDVGLKSVTDGELRRLDWLVVKTAQDVWGTA